MVHGEGQLTLVAVVWCSFSRGDSAGGRGRIRPLLVLPWFVSQDFC